MGVESIDNIQECFRIINELRVQIDSNMESFEKCISDEVVAEYNKASISILEKCDVLERYLKDLQSKETGKLL